MSFLDKAKGKAAEAAGKASELGDKAKHAAEALDERTGGKVGDTVDKVRDKLPTDKIPGMPGRHGAEEAEDTEDTEPPGGQDDKA